MGSGDATISIADWKNVVRDSKMDIIKRCAIQGLT